jgi:hypothetical protein
LNVTAAREDPTADRRRVSNRKKAICGCGVFRGF